MTRLNPTPEILADILAHIPEGFIRYDLLLQRIKLDKNARDAIIGGTIGRDGDWWYDTARLTVEQLRENRRWAKPLFPDMNAKGMFLQEAITAQSTTRAQRVQEYADPAAAQHVLQRLAATPGYALFDDLCQSPGDEEALQFLLKEGDLRQHAGLIFDLLRVGSKTIRSLASRQRLAPIRQQLTDILQAAPGCTMPFDDLAAQFGMNTLNELLDWSDFKRFEIQLPKQQKKMAWVRLASADPQAAQEVAQEATRNSWEKALTLCGDVIRPGGKDGNTARMQVIARTYTVINAAKRIGVRQRTLEQAINAGRIQSFTDPEGVVRLPADSVEAAFENPEYAEHITAFESVTARDVSLVAELSYSTVRRRLQKVGVSRTDPVWSQVRGRWNLPDTYREFRTLLKEKTEAWREQRQAEYEEQQRAIEEQREAQEAINNQLREKLVAAFPTWQHESRAEQKIVLHVGPPNSGKTHQALEALAATQSGWYLAPLRLLAFEIFERLNQRGIRCNLLTGEEFIPIPDATFTAATVEMFNAQASGDCVIIDEAQMLADPDRGWAWTRALMEAEAPEIHVIGPNTARELIERMASAAEIPLEVIEHGRLAPIQIAEHHWPLNEIPERTILVAFSRAMVLSLKTELERVKRRVSVVYGNLPPEVRRKQAERFATGETDVCIATDAVGMGLNLPADYVCFYEVEKYDGRSTRALTPAEVQQIGGRAGRFGLSTAGEIGATNKQDLRFLRRVYYEEAEPLTHARVAPTVQDLELIPGSLAEKLYQWSLLQSIPESLRGAIKTADMTERIELAQMLTDREVKLLGLEAALKLVNAPARISSRNYWYRCARAILTDKEMPLPPVAPREITNTIELEAIELSVACSDIYLWLSQRREFMGFAPGGDEVRAMRADWSVQIDEALLRRINTARRCTRCGVPLPLKHRFAICNNCYHSGRGHDDYYDRR